MTNKDFSHGFDVLLNSYAQSTPKGIEGSIGGIILNEYEKSLYLTKAQEEVVLALYNGKNPHGESFEMTEEIRRYLSSLVTESKKFPIGTDTPQGVSSYAPNTASYFFELPENVWFITYETINISGSDCPGRTTLDVIPITQDEYHKIKRNPFRGANDRRALRLDLEGDIIEIISKYNVTEYYIRYLKKLSPIVLINFEDEISIDGVSIETPCEVHEGLHQVILDRAVLLAAQSRGYKNSSDK